MFENNYFTQDEIDFYGSASACRNAVIKSIATGIATKTDEPQDARHYLLSADELVGNQPLKCLHFIENSEARFARLGGTTFQYSVWAVAQPNKLLEIWHVPYDPEGRWVKAKKRSWNK